MFSRVRQKYDLNIFFTLAHALIFNIIIRFTLFIEYFIIILYRKYLLLVLSVFFLFALQIDFARIFRVRRTIILRRSCLFSWG